MHGIAVALLTEDREHLSTLQDRLETTRLGRAVFSHAGFPAGPTDAVLRQLQDSRAEVVVVDISSQDPQRAIRTIELIRATTQQIAIFANGEMTQPTNIVASMRAGAGEYLDHAAGSEALLDALTRFSSSRTRSAGRRRQSAGIHISQRQGRRGVHDRSRQHRAGTATVSRRRGSR